MKAIYTLRKIRYFARHVNIIFGYDLVKIQRPGYRPQPSTSRARVNCAGYFVHPPNVEGKSDSLPPRRGNYAEPQSRNLVHERDKDADLPEEEQIVHSLRQEYRALGLGECQALACAEKRHWLLLVEERKAHAVARMHFSANTLIMHRTYTRNFPFANTLWPSR